MIQRNQFRGNSKGIQWEFKPGAQGIQESQKGIQREFEGNSMGFQGQKREFNRKEVLKVLKACGFSTFQCTGKDTKYFFYLQY